MLIKFLKSFLLLLQCINFILQNQIDICYNIFICFYNFLGKNIKDFLSNVNNK